MNLFFQVVSIMELKLPGNFYVYKLRIELFHKEILFDLVARFSL